MQANINPIVAELFVFVVSLGALVGLTVAHDLTAPINDALLAIIGASAGHAFASQSNTNSKGA